MADLSGEEASDVRCGFRGEDWRGCWWQQRWGSWAREISLCGKGDCGRLGDEG